MSFFVADGLPGIATAPNLCKAIMENQELETTF